LCRWRGARGDRRADAGLSDVCAGGDVPLRRPSSPEVVDASRRGEADQAHGRGDRRDDPPGPATANHHDARKLSPHPAVGTRNAAVAEHRPAPADAGRGRPEPMAPIGDLALANVAIAGRAVAAGGTAIAARANPLASPELAQPRSLPPALNLALA